jgi:hypothetical protein
MRNPWGFESFNVDYSDSTIDPAIAEMLGHTIDTEDGTFIMSIETYFNEMNSTTFNYDTDGWKHDYVLVLNDDFSGS